MGDSRENGNPDGVSMHRFRYLSRIWVDLRDSAGVKESPKVILQPVAGLCRMEKGQDFGNIGV